MIYCSEFITKVSEVTAKVRNAPLSSTLEKFLKTVNAFDVNPCSNTEKTRLNATMKQLITGAMIIKEAISAKRIELEMVPGEL